MSYKFIEIIKNVSDKYQHSLTEIERKYSGIYYTEFDLAFKIVNNLFFNKKIKNIWNLKFLEPAVGIGNFVFAYLFYISKNYILTKKQVLKLYENIYVCDSDKKALKLYIQLLKRSSIEFFNTKLPKYHTLNVGNDLIYNLNNDNISYKEINSYFNNILFDIIITNPPYKSLRAEKRHYKLEEEYINDKNKYDLIKKDAILRFKYSDKLNANIYKYFIENILVNYTTKEALVALLIPATILTDKSSFLLRKYILENFKVEMIENLDENNKYFNASQSLCYLTINKAKKTDSINIVNYNDYLKEYNLNILQIKKRENWDIILLEETKQKLLNSMESCLKFKDFDFIKIYRGELDLTLNKFSITKNPTKYRLLRGKNIGKYKIIISNSQEYVETSFVKESPKKVYIENTRIGCQQISNINKEKRLVFSEISPNYILGNSCNFIFVDKNNFNISLDYLLGLLNSSLYNWYFKLFSSNNHINNYELKELPLPTNKQLINKISHLVFIMKNEQSNLCSDKIDNIILNYFNNKINFNEIDKINFNEKFENDVKLGIIEKNKKILKNSILNLYHYKLSNLDMDIIKSIPQGGNWKNIPENIMKKSKRLLGIQKTGGRTTLYGRLDYNKPSYTITTYFNRPGNGCNIHPTQNRVLSAREAARLQGFFDDYFFWGNQKDVLNQIGNAVPPLIAFLFANNFKKLLNVKKSIDLFSGAGGLALGVKLAGITSIIANDINYSATVTLKINNPEIEILCDDITKSQVKEKIISLGISNNIDLICGGPPCQGFSLAGYRKENDSRNKLFIDFINIISKINPKGFIFENVIGLLSYNKGKTFNEIKILFNEIGYKIHAEVLNFVEYGVPQKRKRVIIIGIRNDLNIEPINIFPEKYTSSESDQITVFDSINDLDDTLTHQKNNSLFQKLIKKEITIYQYYDFLKLKFQKKDIKQLSIFS
ncbi:DNA (cytosine-5-)-methyltransferase [Fusobacterium watanabei]|uniref:DNA (cytosine-5-)-methyltransferase n=1 Tax=Fusobacterium watanabei TaxID=2686067 RepID=UPI003B5875FF